MLNSKEFRDDLTALLNKHNVDQETQTPDFILTGHILLSLMGVQALNTDRDKWLGRVEAGKEKDNDHPH